MSMIDNYSANIESLQRLYIQYSQDIDFDYSTGLYPTGTETGFIWENYYNPLPHIYNGNVVNPHVWRREKIDELSTWSLPQPISINKSNTIIQTEIILSNLKAELPIYIEDFTIKHNNDEGNKHIPIGGNLNQALVRTSDGYGWKSFVDVSALSLYYTQAQLNSGILDNRYYTEIEIDSLLNNYYTILQLDSGQLDNRYYTETEINTLLSNYYTIVQLDNGQLDNRYYTETEINNLLLNYYTITQLNNGQLDNRYYTETEINNFLLNYYTITQLDNGQLDNRYYTETEIDNLLLDYYTVTQLNNGQLNNLYYTELEIDNFLLDYYTKLEIDNLLLDYYTKVQLDNGQLDNRYYTETEVNNLLLNYYTKTNLQISGQASVHWDNITNVPAFTADEDWQLISLATNVQNIVNYELSCRKLANGDLQVAGAVHSTALTSTIGTLPALYIPTTDQYVIAIENNSGFTPRPLKIAYTGEIITADISDFEDLYINFIIKLI